MLQKGVASFGFIVTIFAGWSLLWQLFLGEFEGFWGEKENRGKLFIMCLIGGALVFSGIDFEVWGAKL